MTLTAPCVNLPCCAIVFCLDEFVFGCSDIYFSQTVAPRPTTTRLTPLGQAAIAVTVLALVAGVATCVYRRTRGARSAAAAVKAPAAVVVENNTSRVGVW